MATVTETGRQGGINEKGERNYTTTYKVYTSDIGDGPGTVAAYVPIAVGAAYSTPNEVDIYARLKSKQAALDQQLNDGGAVWTVTLTYDTLPFGQGEGGLEPGGAPNQADVQPDFRPWQISLSTIKTTKLLTEDVNTGAKVVNSVGIPFDPVPEVPDYHPVITITAYKSIFADSYANMLNYVNKVNSAVWYGFPAGVLLCTDYNLQSQYEQNQWWWQKTVTLEVKAEGWNPLEILNASTVWQESGSKPLQPILDASGNPVTQPVPISLAGVPLNAEDDLVFLEFDAYEEVNFVNLI